MKNIFSFLSRKNLETSLGVLVERFPLPSILVLAITGLILYMIQVDTESLMVTRLLMTLTVTFFLAIGVQFFRESSQNRSFWWNAAPLLYGILFFMSIRSLTDSYALDSLTFFFLHLVGFVSLLFFAPYVEKLGKGSIDTEYTNYFTRIAWTLFMSVIVGVSLLALGSIAIVSVTELFNLSEFTSRWNIYENWATIALSLIAPIYALTHFPLRFDIATQTYDTNRFFSFLVRYIATPFIVIYFVILYAYSIKVLMNFGDWPKGMISWMVIGFSTFGYLTYIFAKPFESESGFIRVFRTVFPFAVPAQILMLGYAIYLRIAQYDLTMNRYFVVIFGVWLAFISLYYIISRRKSLVIIATSLTIISLVISVGPWSVYRLPLTRQYSALISHLTDAGMIVDGKILPKNDTLTLEKENTLYSGIQYVCEYDNCEKIKTLFAAQLAGKAEQYEKNWKSNSYNKDIEFPGMTSWEVVHEVTNALGISYRYEWETSMNHYTNFSTTDSYSDSAVFPLNVRGYTDVLKVSSDISTGGEKQYITINPDTAELTLYGYGTATLRVSLGDFNKGLSEKFTLAQNTNLSKKDLTFEVVMGDFEVKLLLQNYSIKNSDTQAVNTDSVKYAGYISGYALIREKQ